MCLLYLYCINIDMNVIRLSFEQISSIGQKHLWENRQSPIESHSAMTWPHDGNELEYDMKIFEYKPTFFGVYSKSDLVGVNSGHRTKDNLYRSRGIWVSPNFRKTGVSQILFDMTESQAKIEGCDTIWSIPRKSALPAYTKFGFQTVGNFFASIEVGSELNTNDYITDDFKIVELGGPYTLDEF